MAYNFLELPLVSLDFVKKFKLIKINIICYPPKNFAEKTTRYLI